MCLCPWNVPSPRPSSTETLSLPEFAVTRSGSLSPLKSATTTETGLESVGNLVCAWKVPSPRPSSTVTLSFSEFAVTMSGRPSPLTSATAAEKGSGPAMI